MLLGIGRADPGVDRESAPIEHPPMATSDARIHANRLNALKSTGPRTEAGKAISRANALKHGLTATLIKTPEEAQAATERIAAWHSALKPWDNFEVWVVEEIAILTLRIERVDRAGRRLRER